MEAIRLQMLKTMQGARGAIFLQGQIFDSRFEEIPKDVMEQFKSDRKKNEGDLSVLVKQVPVPVMNDFEEEVASVDESSGEGEIDVENAAEEEEKEGEEEDSPPLKLKKKRK